MHTLNTIAVCSSTLCWRVYRASFFTFCLLNAKSRLARYGFAIEVVFMSVCTVQISNHHRVCLAFRLDQIQNDLFSCVQVEAGTSDGAITADEVGTVKSANSTRAANDKAGGLR